MSYVKRTYSPQTPKSGSPSQAIEDSKKKTSLLKDGSWIRKEVDEDEPVDRDSNFGKALLSKYKSNDDLDSAEPANIKSPKTPNTPSSSVQALTKRFGASQDDLNKISTLPSSNPTRTTTYSTKSTTSSLKSDDPKIYNSSSDDFLPVRTSSSNTISSKPSEDYSITTPRKSYSSIPDSYDYTSVTSPTVYTSTSYTDSSRLSDPFDDSLVSKSSIKTVYSAPDRTVQAKDLCSYCRKPMSSDPKMVLDEMKINCHATCFKCEVCNSPLGHLKAGDSMWIYRRTVHCERCFDVTREKWRR
ncbi:sciellin [Aplochiton taeniatus]